MQHRGFSMLEKEMLFDYFFSRFNGRKLFIQIASYRYKKAPVLLWQHRGLSMLEKEILFDYFFSRLNSGELFVQVASPSILGFGAFDKFLCEFRIVAH